MEIKVIFYKFKFILLSLNNILLEKQYSIIDIWYMITIFNRFSMLNKKPWIKTITINEMNLFEKCVNLP